MTKSLPAKFPELITIAMERWHRLHQGDDGPSARQRSRHERLPHAATIIGIGRMQPAQLAI